jgi:hypothetical protein
MQRYCDSTRRHRKSQVELEHRIARIRNSRTRTHRQCPVYSFAKGSIEKSAVTLEATRVKRTTRSHDCRIVKQSSAFSARWCKHAGAASG